MRLDIDVVVGGSELTTRETSAHELIRVIGRAAGSVAAARVWRAGDLDGLVDSNGQVAGTVALVPDWSVGDEVWVTCSVATLALAVIVSVTPVPEMPGFVLVMTRSRYGDQLLTGVRVDHRGFGYRGEPLLGRAK